MAYFKNISFTLVQTEQKKSATEEPKGVGIDILNKQIGKLILNIKPKVKHKNSLLSD
ncbi:MAG: hypothetical protein K9H61_05480 [Bacteroidia bacterium]|nr:hypothetical protein [Bacteroidia bacterium]MCF8425391.1 hypothetical protein [Bacteroidia bacterium]MCF8446432.1 hypothetical protein [Bacteroidia bacterium]